MTTNCQDLGVQNSWANLIGLDVSMLKFGQVLFVSEKLEPNISSMLRGTYRGSNLPRTHRPTLPWPPSRQWEHFNGTCAVQQVARTMLLISAIFEVSPLAVRFCNSRTPFVDPYCLTLFISGELCCFPGDAESSEILKVHV